MSVLFGLSVIPGCNQIPKPIIRWAPTASMATERKFHTATRLNDGRVLVVGGVSSSAYLSSAEIYDPATGTWSPTASMSFVRASHTATLLQDGRVLVVGGLSLPAVPNSASGWRADAEIYNPTTGTWSSGSTMATGRAYHTASLLTNGEVVITGGQGGLLLLSSTEIYTPVTGAAGLWRTTGNLTAPRAHHGAVVLVDGRTVLVAGGLTAVGTGTATATPTAEQYDYTQSKWLPAGSMQSARYNLSLTLLPLSGKALATGGSTTVAPAKFTVDSDLYNWGAAGTPGSWTTLPGIGSEHSEHTATYLPSLQQVLIAGGLPVVGGVDSSRFYAASNSWNYDGGMASRRLGHTATLLLDGRVLVTGGYDNTVTNTSFPPVASAEIFTP